MKNLLLGISIFASAICTAQQLPEYCVYLVKGEVTISKVNTKPVQLKQKQFLYKNEVLTLAKNSEVTLINKDDKLLVLNTAGIVKVNDLQKKFNTPSLSVTKSYLNLAFHELLDPDYDYSGFKEKNVGGTRGGVSRGSECDNLIFPVKELKTSEDSIQFKWHPSGSSGEYSFIIFDSAAKEIFKNKVKDTQQLLSLKDALHGATGKYYWVVEGNESGCENDPISFEIMNKDDEQKLIPSLVLQKGSKDLFSQLQIVDELEKDKWIYTALHYYASIVSDNPGDKPLLKSFVLFLLKYNFNEEASKAWEGAKKKM